jgi:uncharacterized protein (TIGR02453 family)
MRLAFPCTSSLGRCVARGVWHPDGHTFTKIRNAIVEHPQRWQHVISSEAFRATGSLGGDALKRHPSGYDPAHPLLADLKRKDDIAQAHCTAEQACAPDFLPVLTETCRTCAPLMHFLTTALELPWEGDGEGRGVGIRHTTGSAQRGQRLLR